MQSSGSGASGCSRVRPPTADKSRTSASLISAASFFLQPGCWLDSEFLGRYGSSMSTKDMVAALERFDEVELAKFVDELEKHDKLAENLYDLLAFRMRAQEPMRPFEEFVQDLQAKR